MEPATYRTVTLVSVWLLATIIVTGALVRLTGSGLGCSDWPTCEDRSLIGDYGYHGWVEYANRMVTGLVSAIVILAVLGSLRRRPRRRDLIGWSAGLVVGVLAQILLGAAVVYLDLYPRIVIGHFLVSLVLVWNAVVLHHRSGWPDATPTLPVPIAVVGHARLMGLATIAVIVSGTIVTGSGPHTGSLDVDEPIDRLPFDLPDVARIHSALVWVLLIGTVALRGRVRRFGSLATRPVDHVLAVLVAQGALGYTQYALDVPIGLVALHIVGAVALWTAMVRLQLRLVADHRRLEAPAEPPTTVTV